MHHYKVRLLLRNTWTSMLHLRSTRGSGYREGLGLIPRLVSIKIVISDIIRWSNLVIYIANTWKEGCNPAVPESFSIEQPYRSLEGRTHEDCPESWTLHRSRNASCVSIYENWDGQRLRLGTCLAVLLKRIYTTLTNHFHSVVKRDHSLCLHKANKGKDHNDGTLVT